MLPKNFVFLREHKVKDEAVWEYSCKLIFNKKKVVKITITEYYRTRPGREKINNELICGLVGLLNKRRI